MATITFNNSLIKTVASGSYSSISDNFTVNAGFSKGLYVCVYDQTVSSVTYNGVGFTKMNTLTNNGINPSTWWVLLNPDVGTYTLTVNFTTTGFLGWSAVCLNGVDQTASVLDSPHVTQQSSGAGPNSYAWCGDSPSTRRMKPMFAIRAGSLGNFNYNTAFDSDPLFAARTALTIETSGMSSTGAGGEYIGVAVYNTVATSYGWKIGGDHNWGGAVPANSYGWIFINESLLEDFAPQMIII